MESFYQFLMKYDEKWCNTMGFFNPYIDPFDISFSRKVPMFDKKAYNQNPHYNFVYDKLWVTKSQNVPCGRIENIKKDDNINYPIFIKPRWGHKSASSKNCFKVKNYEQLQKYKHLPDMMWSEFVNGKETMTDYILLHGEVIYEITYEYSEDQYVFTEKWKYISPENKGNKIIENWISTYMQGYSGAVNVQYRNDIIIEVSLRLARGGAYIQSTNNNKITELINDIYDNEMYVPLKKEEYNFNPFYSLKSFTQFPIFYIFPQYIIDIIMTIFGCKAFYEYYMEPNGNDGIVFFQFLHENFILGSMCNFVLVYSMLLAQIFFVLIGIYIVYYIYKERKLPYIITSLTLLLYLTQYLNPISVHYNWYKARKQKTSWF